MADNNTYTSKQNVKKYTTQAKFDAIDKSDVPVGTEYNIVGSITESDLDGDLQAKVNLTGDEHSTTITGGKISVRNPMDIYTNAGDFAIHPRVNEEVSSGTQYIFSFNTPLGVATGNGIIPVLGSLPIIPPGASGPVTYHGLFLQNAYTENNYSSEAFSLITPRNGSSGSQVYILPYRSSNPGVSHLLSEYSITAGPGITIRDTTSGQSTPVLEISCSGSGSPSIGSKTYADFVVGAHPDILPVWREPEDGTVYAAAQPAADGGSGYTRFVLLAPTGANSHTLNIPDKSGTLATLDDIPTGGTTYTAGKNIAIDGTTIKTKDDVNFDTAVINALTVATTGIFTRGPINRVPNINFGTLAEPLSATGVYPFANIFTTFGGTKTTYNFKIPSVGGYVDIRFPDITYGNLVAQEQLKTLFGNQNIVGSGNIDLYKHNVRITATSSNQAYFDIVFDFYSSKNTVCDSLTDLKTLLGNNFVINVGGIVQPISTQNDFYPATFIDANAGIVYVTPTEDNYVSLVNCTYIDTVTTV